MKASKLFNWIWSKNNRNKNTSSSQYGHHEKSTTRNMKHVRDVRRYLAAKYLNDR